MQIDGEKELGRESKMSDMVLPAQTIVSEGYIIRQHYKSCRKKIKFFQFIYKKKNGKTMQICDKAEKYYYYYFSASSLSSSFIPLCIKRRKKNVSVRMNE